MKVFESLTSLSLQKEPNDVGEIGMFLEIL